MTKNLKQRKAPTTRKSVTHEFNIAGQQGYFTIGMYEDGTPCEIFINMSKEGSTLSGMMDAFSISISMGLQYGIPLDKFVRKFSYMKFEPSGFSGVEDMGYAHSILDYIFRWTGKFFAAKIPVEPKSVEEYKKEEGLDNSENVCHNCGGLTKRSGTCHVCTNCGTTSGCS